MKRGRIAPPVLGISQNYVICEMCVPDANPPFFLSFFFSFSFTFSIFPFLFPVSCSSLSFLVKLEQLDLGGNDLEVLVGEGWWGGNTGGW